MRILPIALVDPPHHAAELIERAHHSSAITHGAPECLAACAVYVLVARRLADGERDRPSALAAAFEDVEADYRRRGDPALLAALELLRGHAERKGRGWVIDSFWSAWDAFAQHSTYRDAVTAAVKYGKDTDTTAAIAGGLAGLYWGLDGSAGGTRRNGFTDCATETKLRRCSVRGEPVRTHERLHAIEGSPR